MHIRDMFGKPWNINCHSACYIVSSPLGSMIWPRGYKTFSMLNSTEHEIFPAHKC